MPPARVLHREHRSLATDGRARRTQPTEDSGRLCVAVATQARRCRAWLVPHERASVSSVSLEVSKYRLDASLQRPYSISVSILNIGRYIAMMITPTIAPTAIIMRGSMIEVSALIAASTSSS